MVLSLQTVTARKDDAPFIAYIKKLLDYKHLEKNQWINLLAPCVALSLQYVALIKKRMK
jgi:hypothetical protein